MHLTQPVPGAHYFIDPTLAGGFQRLPLRVSGGQAPYRWRVDGRVIHEQKLPGIQAGDFFWRLQPGRHEACATDRWSAEACASFRVD